MIIVICVFFTKVAFNWMLCVAIKTSNMLGLINWIIIRIYITTFVWFVVVCIQRFLAWRIARSFYKKWVTLKMILILKLRSISMISILRRRHYYLTLKNLRITAFLKISYLILNHVRPIFTRFIFLFLLIFWIYLSICFWGLWKRVFLLR